MHHSQRWTDEQILDILDKRERLGISAAEIARRLGVSRNSVLGVIFRVNRETDLAEIGADACLAADNRDGGMPPRWWAKRRRLS